MSTNENSAEAAAPTYRRNVAFITLAVLLAVLYFAREVIIPIALAVFLAFLLSLVVRRIEGRWIGRIPAIAMTMLLALAAFLSVGGVVAYQVGVLIDDLPKYQDNIRDKVRYAQSTARGWFGEAARTIEEMQTSLKEEADANAAPPIPQALPEEPKPLPVQIVSSGNFLASSSAALQAMAHPLVTVGMALVLTCFFLIYWEDLRDRLLRILGQGRLHVSTTALIDAGMRVSHYLGAFAAANIIDGTAVGLGLLVIGVPNWFLWGVLAMVLRFVPFLGPLIAATLPIGVSLAVSDTWTQPLLTASWFILVELASSNVIEPWLYGTRTGASPTAVMLAFIFWTWLWGPFGLFLAMPLTVCLVALGRHIPDLELIYVLLGDQPVFRPEARVYQRLLAADAGEARRVLESESDFDRLTMFDRIIGPAVGRISADWSAGLLQESRHERVLTAVKEALVELPAEGKADDASTTPTRRVVLWSSGHPLEDALLPTVARALEEAGVQVSSCDGRFMINDVANVIQEFRPAGIVLLATPVGRPRRIALLQRRLGELGSAPQLLTLMLDTPDRRLSIPERFSTPRGVVTCNSLAQVLKALQAVPVVAQAGEDWSAEDVRPAGATS